MKAKTGKLSEQSELLAVKVSEKRARQSRGSKVGWYAALTYPSVALNRGGFRAQTFPLFCSQVFEN